MKNHMHFKFLSRPLVLVMGLLSIGFRPLLWSASQQNHEIAEVAAPFLQINPSARSGAGYNPFTAEGKKTAAFEIWEWMVYESAYRAAHLLRNSPPLSVFVSVGDGNIISGIHKGFKDLAELGWLEPIPHLFGVQAEGSAAIANAFSAGSEIVQPVHADTLADSISVDLPRDGVRPVRAARQTGGAYITVRDSEILEAIAALGKAGMFAEPAGATSYAGLVKARQLGLITPDDLVLVISGSGLKDVKAAMQAVPQAAVIDPTLESLKRVMQNHKAMRATEKDRLHLETEISRLVEQMKNLGAIRAMLFGSLARGQISLFSDIDLLVIFKDDHSPRELIRWVYQNAVSGEAVDVIAHSPQSLETMRDRPFLRYVPREGR